jgi:chaperonin cofactor prefoldin
MNQNIEIEIDSLRLKIEECKDTIEYLREMADNKYHYKITDRLYIKKSKEEILKNEKLRIHVYGKKWISLERRRRKGSV